MSQLNQSSLNEHENQTGHPLGPMIIRLDSKATGRTRWRALVVGLACFGLLSVAWTLTPDAHGLGTHRQLGLAPCSLVMMTGYPCPTCGMTTSFSYAVRGQLLSALNAQPAGLFVAIMVLLVGVIAITTALTGRAWRVNWFRVSPFQIGIVCVVILLLGWGYKVLTMVYAGQAGDGL